MTNAPLSSGSRLQRGFRRIGIVIAVPTMMIGLIVGIFYGYFEFAKAQSRETQVACFKRQIASRKEPPRSTFNSNEVDVSRWGCDGPIYSPTMTEIQTATAPQPSFIENFFLPFAGSVGIAAVIATASISVFFALGWTLAGFTRD